MMYRWATSVVGFLLVASVGEAGFSRTITHYDNRGMNGCEDPNRKDVEVYTDDKSTTYSGCYRVTTTYIEFYRTTYTDERKYRMRTFECPGGDDVVITEMECEGRNCEKCDVKLGTFHLTKNEAENIGDTCYAGTWDTNSSDTSLGTLVYAKMNAGKSSPNPCIGVKGQVQVIWDNARTFVKRICNDCRCRAYSVDECENSVGGRANYCRWDRIEAACRYDVLLATPPFEMRQCDVDGVCSACQDVVDKAACGRQTYLGQRVNCTWDVVQEIAANGRGCVPSITEIQAREEAVLMDPQRAYTQLVTELEAPCSSLEALEGPQCKANENCTFRYNDEYPLKSYCVLKYGSPAHRQFYTELGYSKEWIDKQALCHLFTMQVACTSSGCSWENYKCVVSVAHQCALQCEVSAPHRLQWAYQRTTNLQCGEPCDVSQSRFEAGEDNMPYTLVNRSRAEKTCGERCLLFGKCNGFDVDSGTGRCYYRKDVFCYTRRNSNRDCYAKKAKCNTMTCPAGYLALPDEREAFCHGLTCDVNIDREACCKKALCIDEPEWTSGAGCEANGYGLHQGCTENGWTCKAYEVWNWCEPSSIIARGSIVPNTEWAFGEAHRYPERHCCICGGGMEVLPANVGSVVTPPPLPLFARLPPEQHICCIAKGPLLSDIRATLPEKLNHTAVNQVQCTGRPAGSTPLSPVTKPGAVCQYCTCVFDEGANLYNQPVCCSLRGFGKPGVDKFTGLPYCAKFNTQLNLVSEKAKSCELRYDLYPFTAGSASRRLLLPLFTTWMLTILRL